MDIQQLENNCRTFLSKLDDSDVAHNIDHIQRVVINAKRILMDEEEADEEVTLAAAWLHDCVILPKNSPDRHLSSELASSKATSFLKEIGFNEDKLEKAAHAIKAHSFSARIKAETIEAKIVQDADRLDALGAVGIARCFTVGGSLSRTFYSIEDPFCDQREPDDSKYTLDHFYSKLLKLPELMNTDTGIRIARERVQFMKQFLNRLREETQCTEQ